MVVDDPNLMNIGGFPPEDESPLLVDSYAVEAFEISFEKLEAIPWR